MGIGHFLGPLSADGRHLATCGSVSGTTESVKLPQAALLGHVRVWRTRRGLGTWGRGDGAEGPRVARAGPVGASTGAAPLPGSRARARPWLLARDRLIDHDLSRRSGALVFAASRGDELSWEDDSLQNGVFTSALRSALETSAADANRDGEVSLDELRAFVARTVAARTGDKQHPFPLARLSETPRRSPPELH